MFSKEERIIRLLQYLKKYTDKDNPASTSLIDYYFEQKGVPDLFGPKESRRKSRRLLIKELVRVLNTDIHGNLLPREEWRLMYDGFGDETKDRHGYICNLYYVQPFNECEIRDIINSIESNPELDYDKKEPLKTKVKKHLSNKNYETTDPFLRRGVGPVEKLKYLKDKKRKSAYIDCLIEQKLKN